MSSRSERAGSRLVIGDGKWLGSLPGWYCVDLRHVFSLIFASPLLFPTACLTRLLIRIISPLLADVSREASEGDTTGSSQVYYPVVST